MRRHTNVKYNSTINILINRCIFTDRCIMVGAHVVQSYVTCTSLCMTSQVARRLLCARGRAPFWWWAAVTPGTVRTPSSATTLTPTTGRRCRRWLSLGEALVSPSLMVNYKKRVDTRHMFNAIAQLSVSQQRYTVKSVFITVVVDVNILLIFVL